VTPQSGSEVNLDWRGVLLRVGLFLLIGILGLMVFASALSFFLAPDVNSMISTFAAAALANAITVRVYERGRLSDLGLGWLAGSRTQLLWGLGLGAAAPAIILGDAWAASAAKFQPTEAPEHKWATLAFVACLLLFAAAGEELLFHGYAFQVLIRAMGPYATILPVGVLFGFMHAGNPNVKPLALLNTMLWGILLGWAYLRSGALWLPIGLHFGWNLSLMLIEGNVSGIIIGATGYQLVWYHPSLWSGGAYGLEGSPLTAIAAVVLFFVIRRVVPSPDREGGGSDVKE
jgi:membrane protease YdiL (CAAX protease family)